MTFAAGAQRLAGLTARVLGWRPAEFWDATPAELATVLAPEAIGEPAPLSRVELEQLMERHGDG